MAPIVVVSQTPTKPARDNPNLVPEHVVNTHNDWLKHGIHEYGARQSIVGGFCGISDTKSKIGALPSLSAPQTQQLWPKTEFIECIQRIASRSALAITSFERTPLMSTGIIKQQIHTAIGMKLFWLIENSYENHEEHFNQRDKEMEA